RSGTVSPLRSSRTTRLYSAPRYSYAESELAGSRVSAALAAGRAIRIVAPATASPRAACSGTINAGAPHAASPIAAAPPSIPVKNSRRSIELASHASSAGSSTLIVQLNDNAGLGISLIRLDHFVINRTGDLGRRRAAALLWKWHRKEPPWHGLQIRGSSVFRVRRGAFSRRGEVGK